MQYAAAAGSFPLKPGPAARRPVGAWHALALLAGVLLVGGYDHLVGEARYAYSSDSASYLEMAQAMRDGRAPGVVPWGLELPDQDVMGQPLFPPGLPLLVALAAPFAGGAKAALALLPRLAAALLPLVLLVVFRGALGDGLLVLLGVAVLCTRGIAYWHYVGYSDVPGLVLAIAALGVAWQAGEARDRRTALLAGLLAGLCYAVRNAGLGAIVAVLCYWVVEIWRERRAWRPAAAWLTGLLPVVAALKLYNLVEFGTPSPYLMPASTRGFMTNLADWVSAQVGDLRLRAADATALPHGVALLVLVAVGGVCLVGWWRLRASPATRLARLLAVYVAAGGAMTVLSRTLYEWGGFIDDRHALQYSFALLLTILIGIEAGSGQRYRRLAGTLLAGLTVWLSAGAVEAALIEREEPEELARLAADPGFIGAVHALPPETWIASDSAALLRIETSRRVRQSDFGGDDADLAAHLAELARRVAPRPVAFVLVCDRWTRHLSACNADGIPAAPCALLRSAPPRAAMCRAPALASGGPPGGAP